MQKLQIQLKELDNDFAQGQVDLGKMRELKVLLEQAIEKVEDHQLGQQSDSFISFEQ